MNIVIIGGGASGLMCALSINKKHNVTILEQSFKVGKKILISGNGRCNLSNKNLNKTFYTNYPEAQLNKFNNFDALNFFNKLGLNTYFDTEGRAYPTSHNSNSVLDVMLNNLNCNVVTNCTVTNVVKTDNRFVVETTENNYPADKVVFAVGGEFNNKILSSLKVNTIQPTPMLCGLKVNTNLDAINGVKAKVKVTAENFAEVGEVVFKTNAVSGICIFNLSVKNPKTFELDFFNELTYDQLVLSLSQRKQNLQHLKATNFLDGMLNTKLGKFILNKLGLTKGTVKNLTEQNIFNIASLLKCFKFSVVGKEDNNQVFAGGVPLSDLNINLEHKNVKNFFVAGEAVDVVGVCGGYNLQWAWTSGFVIGSSL